MMVTVLFFSAFIYFITQIRFLIIGNNYWDVQIYVTASYRFLQHQLPHVDYFSPVGILDLAMFHLAELIFPRTHPLLLAQISILPLSATLFAIAIVRLDKNYELWRLTLILIFFFYSIMPYNIYSNNISQAPDAFGIYNRHSNIFLYILCLSIFLTSDAKHQAIVAYFVFLATLFIKISAFFMAACITIVACVTGFIGFSFIACSFVALALTLLALETFTSIPTAYLLDLEKLMALNDNSLLQHVGRLIFQQIPFVLACSTFIVCGLFYDFFWLSDRSSKRRPSIILLNIFCITLVGVVFESQNSGSVEFIYLTIPILCFWSHCRLNGSHLRKIAIVAATVIIGVPIFKIANRAAAGLLLAYRPSIFLFDPAWPTARVMLSQNEFQFNKEMMYSNSVSKSEMTQLELYSRALSRADLPATSEFQVQYVISVMDAAHRLEEYQKENGVKINSIFTLDFVDPFPGILKVSAARRVSLAIDPGRTFPPMSSEELEVLQAIDAIIMPTCPAMPSRLAIRRDYQTILTNRKLVHLTPCWDMFLQ